MTIEELAKKLSELNENKRVSLLQRFDDALAEELHDQLVEGVLPTVKKIPKLSRRQRWEAACSDAFDGLERLTELQQEYQEWRDNLPESLESSSTAELLDAICELEIESVKDQVSDFESADLPRGFGRD